MEEVAQPSKSSQKKAAKMAGKAEKKEKQVPIVGGKKEDSKEIIGMTASKDTNFSMWYQELVVKAEMVEYYNEVRERECACACVPDCASQLTPDSLLDLRLLHPPT
jgi:hypothetical protein